MTKNTEDRIQNQLRYIDKLQAKMIVALEIASTSDVKDVAIALQAAIDGLRMLQTMEQNESESTVRDQSWADFEAKRKQRKDQEL